MSLVIVGIGGPSSSGKTTVARALQLLIPQAKLIHLDDFYYPDDQIPVNKEHNVANWDCPEAIDWSKFSNYIRELRENDGAALPVQSLEMDTPLKLKEEDITTLKPSVEKLTALLGDKRLVLVEGFMLFHDEAILLLFDKKLFFHGPHDVLKDRRESRPGYQTIDGFWEDPPNYFDNIVWPEYKRTHEHLFGDLDVEKQLTEHSKSQGIAGFNNDGSSDLVQMTRWALQQLDS